MSLYRNLPKSKFISAGIPAHKISVKPNFVYEDPGEHTGKGEYALFVGRLSPEKGLSTLIAAWASLPIPLVVVGDGPMRSELEIQVRGHASNIDFRGRLGRDQTRALMKGALFLVVPSECYENFPMVIAEAFACGTPVIGSRLGAVAEIIADGHTGLHFSPGDSSDLQQKARWAWSNPDQMMEMGRHARIEYESKYTPERNYPVLMKIYQRAIESHP